jgi:D-amino-acid oxidase
LIAALIAAFLFAQERQRRHVHVRLSAESLALVPSTATSPHVVVVGSGISGLMSTWFAVDSGHRVTIVAKSRLGLVSNAAAAVWEMPPAGCGPQTNGTVLAETQQMALTSFDCYRRLAADPALAEEFGVAAVTFLSLHRDRPIRDDAVKLRKMDAVKALPGFRWDKRLLEQRHSEFNWHGIVDAYEHLTFVVDPDKMVSALQRLLRRKGVRFVTAEVSANGTLMNGDDADALVIAAGLGSRVLADDSEMVPVRGALLRLVNDGKRFPKLTRTVIVSGGSRDHDGQFRDSVFLVPRGDLLLVGCLSQAHEEALDLTMDSPEIKDLLKSAVAFYPALANAEFDAVPLTQGVRPFRLSGVRVERNGLVIVNYGHGGAGYSLAFGAAEKTLDLITQALVKQSL